MKVLSFYSKSCKIMLTFEKEQKRRGESLGVTDLYSLFSQRKEELHISITLFSCEGIFARNHSPCSIWSTQVTSIMLLVQIYCLPFCLTFLFLILPYLIWLWTTKVTNSFQNRWKYLSFYTYLFIKLHQIASDKSGRLQRRTGFRQIYNFSLV